MMLDNKATASGFLKVNTNQTYEIKNNGINKGKKGD